MCPQATSAFALPDQRRAKADPILLGADEQHLAAVATSLAERTADVSDRLEALRLAPGGHGRAALDRDLEIHRLTANLRTLRRFGADLCLGRMVPANPSTDASRTHESLTHESLTHESSTHESGTHRLDPEPVYVGRLGLTDRAGRRLLVDWRAPAAEPFFAATHAHPMGLSSRRRYRWVDGRVDDYWDEVFTPDGLVGHAALDDQSAFVASLGSSRSAQMRDVLATIQADQDAIIRASSRGALVVEGGPGTGKTVVALHRAAYLLYADPRLGAGRGGVLFVGPHRPYLNYIADVLPSLGEEGVQTCTLRDLVVEGTSAGPETDPELARLKASVAMVAAIEPAVRLYEEPPAVGQLIETEVSDVWLSPTDWSEAFTAPDPGTPHNEAREQVLDALLDILVDKHDDAEVAPDLVRRALRQNPELVGTLSRAWTLIEAADLVGDLWSVPAYLRRSAPQLSADEVRRLQRLDPQAWTVADLPLLDAARRRLGDPDASRRRRRREAALAAERASMDQVVADLLAADDDPEGSTQLLRRDSIRDSLVDDAAVPSADPTRIDERLLAGPFAHVVVDEAQELTDAEWLMLLRRCPSRSFTIVGDRAQARHGFSESWRDRLERIGFDLVEQATLSINYRTPVEVMAAAEPLIRAVFPAANVPTSVRRGGAPVVHGSTADLAATLETWLDRHADGVACVISTATPSTAVGADPAVPTWSRVRHLTPEFAKGLEFDLVVLVDPHRFGDGPGVAGTVDRYVAMTRATQQLVILSTEWSPAS